MNQSITSEIEAAAFRRLLNHLQTHTDVQNIDLMILADFCRNCLAKWMVEEAKQRNVELDYETAREQVYGMPYNTWKEQYQLKASPEQLAAYEQKQSQQQ